MEHLVRFTSNEGREGHHSAPSLDDALQFVEHIRNTEGAEGVQVFRLQPIHIEFKTYYRVEVTADAVDAPQAVSPPAAPNVPPGVPMQQPAQGPQGPVSSVEAAAEANGRRLFSR